jgi:hypothetical protein
VNNGDGTFSDIAADRGAHVGEWSWGTSFLDMNSDSRLDAVLAVGWSELLYQARADVISPRDLRDATAARASVAFGQLPLDPRAQLPTDLTWPVAEDSHPRTDNTRLLVQQPDGSFRLEHLGEPGSVAPVHYGTAVGDYDNDGRPDLVIGKLSDGYSLLRNSAAIGRDNGRLVVDVRGDGEAVSTDAVGTRVTVIGANGDRQVRVVRIGGSLGSGEDRRLLFGLGRSSTRAITIEWPDGSTERISGDFTNEILTITYGEESSSRPLTAR